MQGNNNLQNQIADLKQITNALASELHTHEYGPAFAFITFIFNKIDNCVAILDEHQKMIFVNDASVKLAKECGEDATSYIGKSCTEIKKCGGMVCESCPVKQVLTTRRVTSTPIKSSYDKQQRTLVCIPLLYDGVSAVILIAGDAYDRRHTK